MSSRAHRVRPPGPGIPSSPTASSRTAARYATGAGSAYGTGIQSSPSYAYSSTGNPYPTFLPVWETARLHFRWALSGLIDACRWDRAVVTVMGDPEIQLNALKAVLLNGLSLVSIFTFDFLILPLLPDQSRRGQFHRNLGAMYNVLWLWPVVGVSLWFNNIWSTTIARKSFVLQHGQVAVSDTSSYSGMLQSVATSAYRAIFLASYVVLQLCLSYVPYVGPPVGFVFTCWVNSYYCFEFVGVARGMNLAERLKHHEERWAYFFAFGLPSAILCMWGGSLANAACYALVFPAFIIMAMHANPVPRYPYAPATSATPGQLPALLSPFIPIRVPIFAPVLALNDIVVRALSVSTRTQTRPGSKRWATQRMEVVEEGTDLDDFDVRRKAD